MIGSQLACPRGGTAPSSVVDSAGSKAFLPWCRTRRARCAACRPPAAGALNWDQSSSSFCDHAPRVGRLIFVSPDRVGPEMAGPGVRYVELARQLAKTHDVLLAAPT